MRCQTCDYTDSECKSDYFLGQPNHSGSRFFVYTSYGVFCSQCAQTASFEREKQSMMKQFK